MTVPALFKRKSADVDDNTEETDQVESEVDETEEPKAQARDKFEPTPKRPKAVKKRPPKNPPLTNKEAREQAKAARGPKPDKETRRQQAADRRAERERIAEGQDRGDPLFDKYHMPRDKGPERLLVRDLVDARRSVGQYFFLIAIMIMLLSDPRLGAIYQLAVLAWIGLLLVFVVDSVILCRKVNRLVFTRYPKSKQRKFGLCWYAISRSIMFRRLRMPRPRTGVTPGMAKEDLGKQFD